MSVGLQEDERDSKVGMLTDFISGPPARKGMTLMVNILLLLAHLMHF